MYLFRRLALAVALAHLIVIVGLPGVSQISGVSGLYSVSEAHAQDAKPKKRRSLFSILFGKKKPKKKKATAKSKKKRSKKSRSASAASKAAAVEVLPKREDARVILVVGDFFASGLADGLKTALAQVPTLKVVNKSKGLSGFVRTDIVDWSLDLQPLVDEHKPAYIVAMLGSNDRQQIRKDGKRLKKQTPEWTAAYTERVQNLGKALKATGVDFAWVGLPPVRFKSMTKDFLLFNEIYGRAAESRRGQFIDIWDGFSDAEGNYSRSGPDVNGQIVLLRSKDGINLTRAGKRRLSYYVEGRLQKLFRSAFGSGVGLASTGFEADTFEINSPSYDPAKTGKTYVVRLDDPNADGGDELAGEKIELTKGPARIVAYPEATAQNAAARSGRVDNFIWPPQDNTGDVEGVALDAPLLRPVPLAKPKAAPSLPQSSALDDVLKQGSAVSPQG